VTRRRYSLYIEQALSDRLHLYAAALSRVAGAHSLAGLHESALWEYLERRCDRLGRPLPGTDPRPQQRAAGRGRPSAAALAGRFSPHLLRRAGRPAGVRSSTLDPQQ
jgi:hypothetical protein